MNKKNDIKNVCSINKMSLFPFITYNVGVFLGIQIGKEACPYYYRYFLSNYNKEISYYKNNQMDYRFNK